MKSALQARVSASFSLTFPILVGMLSLAGLTDLNAQDQIFPDDAGLIDVTQSPYFAPKDGTGDATAALQKALDDYPGQSAIIYLPAGTYLISDQLKWAAPQKRTVLQGQAMEKTIIRLKDAAPGFTDASLPKAMVWTGKSPAQRFGNGLRSLTLHSGSGNPGAIGAQFIANNQGCIRDVIIQSGDGRGILGLDMAYSDEIGPLLVKNLTVIGFDIGIKTGHRVDAMVFEHVILRNQKKYGYQNAGQCVSFRGLKSENSVPAILNSQSTSLLSLIDADLTGTGAASDTVAVVNEAALFARNISVTGYSKALVSKVSSGAAPMGLKIEEFTSHAPLSLFPSPPKSLGLPIRETPEVAWDPAGQWVNVRDHGALPGDKLDDTKAIQAAIDAATGTVYLPRGSYRVSGTLSLRGKLKRLIGCEAYIELTNQTAPAMALGAGESPVVVVERISSGYHSGPFFDNVSERTLVIRDCANVSGIFTGKGDIFMEDVVSNPQTGWVFNGQKVWARQFNVENQGTHILNNGGTLWILGYKTERGGVLIENTNGARTEVLGGFVYSTSTAKTTPAFVNNESAMTLVMGEANFNGNPYQDLVQETRMGATKTLVKADSDSRGGIGFLFTLYTGYPAGLSPLIPQRTGAPKADRSSKPFGQVSPVFFSGKGISPAYNAVGKVLPESP